MVLVGRVDEVEGIEAQILGGTGASYIHKFGCCLFSYGAQ